MRLHIGPDEKRRRRNRAEVLSADAHDVESGHRQQADREKPHPHRSISNRTPRILMLLT
jgi:hypothetical protein